MVKQNLNKKTTFEPIIKPNIYKSSNKMILIIDCDGVMTDGKSYYNLNGKTFKAYGCHDKEALKEMNKIGWEIHFVTDDSEGYNITRTRIHHLKRSFLCSFDISSPEDRKNLVKAYKDKGYFVVFIGDSVSDIPALLEANIGCTVNNAFPLVKEYCDYVSDLDGGNGGLADILYGIYN